MIESIQSNIVSAHTIRLQHLYGYDSGIIYIWDVKNPYTPFLAASVTVSSASGVGVQAYDVLVDADYLYLMSSDAGYSLTRIYSLANPLLPVLVATLPISNAGERKHILVRRGLAHYNNLLFTEDAGQSVIQCYDISSPASPVLKSSIASGMSLISPGLDWSFDAVRGRLYYGADTGGGRSYAYLNVAEDGTLSAGSSYIILASSPNWYLGGGFIYANRYWIHVYGDDRWRGYPLEPLGEYDTFFGSTFNHGGHRGRLIGSLLYKWGGDAPLYSGFSGLSVMDLTSLGNPFTGAERLEIGTLEIAYNSCVISGNYIYAFRADGYLQIWNKTSMNIPENLPPDLIASLAPVATTYTGAMGGYVTDDWDGNNGRCAS